jgi:hypothetical protein
VPDGQYRAGGLRDQRIARSVGLNLSGARGDKSACAGQQGRERARKLADEHARTFKCGKDKRIALGNKGAVDLPSDDE